MLRSLEIHDILIIDALSLDFAPGLNVLTGETGAGKSILLDALGMALGWRTRGDLVRPGAARGEVTAEFELSPTHPAREILREAGLPEEDGLILRRATTPEGRKTAWVNDRRVTGEVLRQLSDRLVELHGQHDDRGLLNPAGHRALLDAFAGHDGLMAEVRAAWEQLAEARAALARGEAELAAARAEEDYLRHAVAELDELDPAPVEEGELDARRRMMQAAGRVREDIARAAAALGVPGAEGAMGDAWRWLEGAAPHVGEALDAPLSALSRAMTELGEAAQGVEAVAEALDFDPGELERVEERLFAIRGLARKHKVAPDELGTFAIELRSRLERLDAGAERLGELSSAVKAATARYAKAAEALATSRRTAAKRLDAAVAAELAPLKMERALFVTEITETEPGPSGSDQVAFKVATNPGAAPGPIARVASGGELSRVLLAVKVCLARETGDVTLIFDEIDRGVGGATADAVGRRLAALAAEGQVLVVTHSPQVAAFADRHFRVEKRSAEDAVVSTVTALEEAERIDELARMLAGDTVTEEARAAARALLSA